MKRVIETAAFPIGVFVVTIVGVVLVLPDGGYLQQNIGVSLPDLIPFAVLVGTLYLLGEAVERSKPEPPTGPRKQPSAHSIASVIFRGGSYAVGLYALLIATPPIVEAVVNKYDLALNTSRLELLVDLAPWAGGIFAFFVLVRASGMVFPLISQVFYVPRFILIGLAGLYVLIGEHGFVTRDMAVNTPPFWTVMAVATLAYLARSVRRSRLIPGTWPNEGKGPSGHVGTWVAINLLLATAAAGVTWATLNAAPQVSEFASDNLDVYVSKLYDIRHLAATLVWVLVVAWSLRPLTTNLAGRETSSFTEAVAWASGAGLAWAIGTTLPPSPSGYLLVATMVAVGLLFTSLSALARIAIGRNWLVVEDAAGWLAMSQWRAFVLGASLVVYGLFLRPMMYYSMWYAPILEWIAVISLAVLILVKTTSTIRQQVEITPRVAPFPIWTKHRQHVTTNPDHHYIRVTELQRAFVNNGGLIGIWAYVAMVLVQNRVPLGNMAYVLGPLGEYYMSPSKRLWFTIPSRAERREQAHRLQVIEDTVKRMDGTLEHAAEEIGKVDSAALHTLGSAIVRSQEALPFVAALIVASHQNGAPVTVAAIRWLRMLNVGQVSARWNLLPWQRKRSATLAVNRRKRLIDDSVAQALEPTSNRGVYMATTSWPVRIFTAPSYHSRVLTEVEPGTLFEVRAAAEEYHTVITSNHLRGYASKEKTYLQRVGGQYFENRFGEYHEAIRSRGSRGALR